MYTFYYVVTSVFEWDFTSHYGNVYKRIENILDKQYKLIKLVKIKIIGISKLVKISKKNINIYEKWRKKKDNQKLN